MFVDAFLPRGQVEFVRRNSLDIQKALATAEQQEQQAATVADSAVAAAAEGEAGAEGAAAANPATAQRTNPAPAHLPAVNKSTPNGSRGSSAQQRRGSKEKVAAQGSPTLPTISK